MAINEIFPNPVVKEVAFEARFPNLFYLESKVGDFQLRVIKQFPESDLVLRRHFVFGGGDQKGLQELIASRPDDESVQKVWRFSSKDGVTVNLSSQSIAIISSAHKSYSLSDKPFRNVIDVVIGAFLDVLKLPLMTRVGLRYINHCPLSPKSNAYLGEHYNSAFDIARFPIDDAVEMQFVAMLPRHGCQLRYAETLSKIESDDKLILDYDAWRENVEAKNVMDITDMLHTVIANEFESSVKPPLLDLMRRPKGSNQ